MKIRYPNIKPGNEREQVEQIRSYLFQLVEQLNMESGSQTKGTIPQSASPTAPFTQGSLGNGAENAAGTPGSTFNQIKSLIIKSADIVDAYYTEINKRLESVYVAESEFGDYKKTATADIKANAERIEQSYNSLQSISDQMDQVVKTNANIQSGRLFVVGEENLEPELGQTLPQGAEVYGVAVGQTTQVDGKEVFNKFARFTSYGMTLYDNNGKLSAYITDSRLNIPNAVIKNSLTRGGFVETIGADGSSVERWVGV